MFILICLAGLTFGLYISFTFKPEVKQDDLKTKIHSNIEMDGRIMTTLLPQWLGLKQYRAQMPDWDQEHWTPISILSYGDDPKYTMCKLNFESYAMAGPHKLPMFKDLVASSQCKGQNSKTMRLSEIKTETSSEESTGVSKSPMIPPSGFVFHESRVGSTLVANLLGSDPFNMVFSESAPPASVLLYCQGCSKEKKVSLFRDTVLAMGRSPVHKHVFFKFQSITSQHMKIALEAFPETPWVFVYRDPVQTMMSHLIPSSGTSAKSAKCVAQSRGSSNKKILAAFDRAGTSSFHAPIEAMCAAHLNMLCESALDAYEEFGHYEGDPDRHRGLLLDYKMLPGAVPNLLLPHFGLPPAPPALLKSMTKESVQYSKSSLRNIKRGKSGVFSGDSEDKEKRATTAIDEWAEKILGPTFDKMTSLSLPVIHSLNGGNTDVATLKKIRGSDSVLAHEEQGVLPSYAYEPFRNSHNSSRYEDIACPDHPRRSYPITYDMKRVLDNWNPDDTNIPPTHFNSICRFDYQKEFHKALNYRNAEKPFIVYNVPEVDEVVQKWSDLDHLNRLVGANKMHGAETSSDNHFMYWREISKKKMKELKYTPPTGHKDITFVDWLKNAVINNNKSLVDREHLYLRVNGKRKGDPIFNELPFFNPVESLFIVDPDEQRGINCRFGMKSVIAENHYDGSRNYVAALGGMRRFILNHPDQCKNLYMYPRGHPSARHSEIDWSKPEYDKYPQFATAQTNEIITTPGDVLYLPTYWFHYIISLNVNFQCNTRSGESYEYEEFIDSCGF